MEYDLGVHLAVPPSITRRILSLRKDALFVRDQSADASFHVTLYLCRFSRPAYDQLLAELRLVRIRPIVVALDRVEVTLDQGRRRFVSFRVRRTQSLVAAHRRILQIGNRLRLGQIREKDIVRIRSGQYSRREREQTVRFGYRGAGPGFSPHVTISEGEYLASPLRKLMHAARQVEGSAWTAKTMVVGLYRYSNTSDRYVGRFQEHRIRLS
ncbi:MAG: hypothetical protein HY421_00445 [Candidatus Kerfeldbacteria bacterium]|nr:hypothetical protein [Candidatus Kerfeldbacteria bacterium]